MTTNQCAVMWFRKDLRLSDNRALSAAIDSNTSVIPLFILDEDNGVPEHLGSASRWWLHHSLGSLASSLADKQNTLVLRKGDSLTAILDICTKSGATQVFANSRDTPHGNDFDRLITEKLRDHGIELIVHSGHLLYPPSTIKSQSGVPYRVFTPFWKAIQKNEEPLSPIPAPSLIPCPLDTIKSDDLNSWRLLPQKPNWAALFSSIWHPGETGANERLETFIDADIQGYTDERDFPSKNQSTSNLSAHLAFGEITPATIWHQASKANPYSQDISTFRKELAWRDFSYGLLQMEPHLSHRNWNNDFDRFEWQFDAAAFEAWKAGRTGYPIVDAGMRQLWTYGTMHNRVRMIAASFLIKHLLIDWRLGEQWFKDTLVDYDPASNTANWQWVAGSGADASPYFRIFNPILQGEKFDKHGDYVRRYVPELEQLDRRYIHRPFEAPNSVLENAGIVLGETYPNPIIDHQFARQRALDAYSNMKAGL